jgi:ADP-heptose:LPS heptosyltransferase
MTIDRRPRKPMVGQYLARRWRSAAVFAGIDLACRLVPGTPPAAPGEPKSILISQGAHIGDLIMTLPVLRWLRRNRPSLRIGLLIGSWSKSLLPSLEGLYDEAHIVDHVMLNRSAQSLPNKLRQHRRTWIQAREEIAARGYDLAIECNPYLANNVAFLRACRIPRRVGFTAGAFGPLLNEPVRWNPAGRHYTDCLRDLLRRAFGDAGLAERFWGFYPPAAGAVSPVEGSFVAVHMGTGNPIREWEESRWSELVRRLSQQGRTVVLLGHGKTEEERAGRVGAGVPGVVDLSGKLTWTQLTAVIAATDHLVCLESSSSHLAAGLGVPVTVVMPGINAPWFVGPNSPVASAATHPMPCAPCFRTMGCAEMDCIGKVSVDQVLALVTPSRPQGQRAAAGIS